MDKRLEQALRTLRAIRRRYETETKQGPGRVRSHTVQVALGYADMLWITAAIEALERASGAPRNADSLAHSAAPVSQPAPLRLQVRALGTLRSHK
jgi:hypothetical protein